MQHTGFPGRWLGGASMVLAPLLLLTGVLLRVQYDFFFPNQLAAFTESPRLMTASYTCFIGGYVLLWPAVSVFAKRIADVSPGWALWGGTMVFFGIFARTFHAGADHVALQTAAIQGAESATDTVAEIYPVFHVFRIANMALFFGWIVLALAAWRTGVAGPVSAAAMALASGLPIGILKGTTTWSIIAAIGLCVALLPAGIRLLARVPRPRGWVSVRWIGLVIVVAVVSFVLGNAG